MTPIKNKVTLIDGNLFYLQELTNMQLQQPHRQEPYYNYAYPPQPRKRNNRLLINGLSAIALVVCAGVAVYLGSYMLTGHPPTVTGITYKEYADVAQAYKYVAIGDRIKVTITVTSSVPVNGIVQVGPDSYHGITFRFSPNNKKPVQLHTGKNIVYGFISERLGTGVYYCDIEDAQP